MKRILVVLLILSLFILPVNAIEFSVSAYFHYNDVLLPIQELNNPYDSFTNLNTFDLYFPVEISTYNDVGSLVISGAFDLDLSNSSSFDFTNLYPTLIGANADSDLNYQYTYDLTDYYNSQTGQINYQNPENNSIFLTSQSSIVDNHFIYNFILIYERPGRRNFGIRFSAPGITGLLRQEASFYSVSYVEETAPSVSDKLSSLTSINTEGFNGVTAAVDALKQQDLNYYLNSLLFFNDFKNSLTSLDTNMSSYVYDAIDDWHNEQESYVNNELDGKVQDIVDKIDDLYDYQQIEDAFSQVISIVTGGASRSPNGSTVLPIPAGTVTINGETLTFWEATEIDFAPYFDIPIIKTLLIPFRFVLAYGFLKYIIYWIRKLVDTITLHVHRPTASGE